MKRKDKLKAADQSNSLRLWPGVVIVVIMWLFRYGLPTFIPEAVMMGVIIEVLCTLAFILWWLFFSRAVRLERWGALVLIAVAMAVTSLFLDVSIATANMGLMFTMYSIPVICLAFVVWALATRNLSVPVRRVTLVICILLASGMWIFIRTNGMTGDGRHDLAWRWAKTDEDHMLAWSGGESTRNPAGGAVEESGEWPGFRGAGRDGIIRGLRIQTDWSLSPPEELWRRPVGPGCSSFAIRGGLIYTQEQRGDAEILSCYALATGKPVWQHEDRARFYDSHAGPGPRSTPTLAGDRVYTLGGTGILNVLNVADGSLVWSRNAAAEAGIEALPWGFTASPLVTGNVVIVALSGRLAAYAMADGKPMWKGPDGGNSYSSPHLLTISGIPQVLLMSATGAVSVDPVSGREIWKYSWPITDRILQPAILENGDLLLSEEGSGVRRMAVTRKGDSWDFMESWTSPDLKVNFNDMVIHKGHVYGFDGPALACVDLSNGKRIWKGNRYRGWLLLLGDQDLLLVLSEKGELALVKAVPDQFTELGRFTAIEGKTWNHPAIAGNIVVVRNAREMAAFRLAAETGLQ